MGNEIIEQIPANANGRNRPVRRPMGNNRRYETKRSLIVLPPLRRSAGTFQITQAIYAKGAAVGSRPFLRHAKSGERGFHEFSPHISRSDAPFKSACSPGFSRFRGLKREDLIPFPTSCAEVTPFACQPPSTSRRLHATVFLFEFMKGCCC